CQSTQVERRLPRSRDANGKRVREVGVQRVGRQRVGVTGRETQALYGTLHRGSRLHWQDVAAPDLHSVGTLARVHVQGNERIAETAGGRGGKAQGASFAIGQPQLALDVFDDGGGVGAQRNGDIALGAAQVGDVQRQGGAIPGGDESR